jgi:hypothetical protein
MNHMTGVNLSNHSRAPAERTGYPALTRGIASLSPGLESGGSLSRSQIGTGLAGQMFHQRITAIGGGCQK